jgi:hypothetical protein
MPSDLWCSVAILGSAFVGHLWRSAISTIDAWSISTEYAQYTYPYESSILRCESINSFVRFRACGRKQGRMRGMTITITIVCNPNRFDAAEASPVEFESLPCLRLARQKYDMQYGIDAVTLGLHSTIV